MNNLTITEGGQALISKLLSGASTAAFTNISVSDKDYSSADVSKLDELKDIKQTAPVLKVTRKDDTLIVVQASLENTDVAKGYYIRDVGLYIKDENNTEILFAVAIDNNPDYMPAYTEKTISGVLYKFNIKVGATEQISITVDQSTAVTQDQIDEIGEAIRNLEIAKVDTEDGKGLSSNDFTDKYKEKIADLIKRISDEDDGTISTNSATMRTLLVDVIKKNIKTPQGANAINVENNVSCTQTVSAKELMAGGKKFTDVSKSVKTLEDIIEHSGIGDKLLEDKQINDSYTFQNLIAESVITFFTNWIDNTNFPQIYGSGVLIPCLDANAKVILYGDIMAGDLYLILSLDAGKRIVTRRLSYEGRKTGAGRGKSSNAFGENNAASETCAFAAGWNCDAIGEYSAALGNSNVASGNSSAALGNTTKATGVCSFSTGHSTNAVGNDSAAFGLGTTAQHAQLAMGYYTNQATSTHDGKCGKGTNTLLCISNGDNPNNCSNAMRVNADGQIYSSNSSITTGADYAEFFEWSDGNPDGEDRVGRFVTFDINKPEMIKYANTGDYLLGIVSGMPSVIGNGDEEWRKRYVLDDFGRYIEEEELVERELPDPETGAIVKSMEKVIRWRENPDYDSTKDYTPRDQRSEWDAVGMLGVLNVYDDGTCKVNGYCKCGQNGIATAATAGYRVIKRAADNIIKIVFR